MDREMELALLRVVLNQSDQGIHMVDTEGITRFYNSIAAQMDGLRSEDVVGKPVLAAFPSLSRDTSTLLRVVRTGRPIYNQHQTYTNSKGREVTTVNTTLPVFGQQGKLLGAVEIARDISLIQQLSEQVADLQRRLYKAAIAPESMSQHGYTFADIIGDNPKLRQVIAQAARAAHTNSPVIVRGETGTGKEPLVQAIHNCGPRRDRPFVAQNCAALPETLLEGILFGSVQGSFTGAKDRPGLFELAHGGTLFLDEINAMEQMLQAKLLRVLETGEVRRLGGQKARRVDVRVIAATNSDPRQALRPDLYYRLSVVNLWLPPLRERREDIPLLCRHFLAKLNARLATKVDAVSPAAMAALQSYHWPGNVRELANLLEGILNFKPGGVIELSDLPEHIGANPAQGLREKMRRKEYQLISQAMTAAGGNISRAAELLNIPRQTLQNKLRRHGWHENCNGNGQTSNGRDLS